MAGTWPMGQKASPQTPEPRQISAAYQLVAKAALGYLVRRRDLGNNDIRRCVRIVMKSRDHRVGRESVGRAKSQIAGPADAVPFDPTVMATPTPVPVPTDMATGSTSGASSGI
jgi:hypothetical protein